MTLTLRQRHAAIKQRVDFYEAVRRNQGILLHHDRLVLLLLEKERTSIRTTCTALSVNGSLRGAGRGTYAIFLLFPHSSHALITSTFKR